MKSRNIRYRGGYLFIFLFVCAIFSTIFFSINQRENVTELISRMPKQNLSEHFFHSKPRSQKRKVWVSIGLCYSYNTPLHGKSKYPYKDVAPLALALWRYFQPEVSTIIQIVYTEPNVNKDMLEYGEKLKKTGAIVEWVPAEDIDCVLKSQLIRLFAIDNENVDDEDIVVTADSNLFVMSKDILDFLYQYPNMTAWVPKYHDTVKQSGPDGTFNQNLIAMKAKMWRQITRYDGKLKNLIQHFRDLNVVNDELIWYTDQLITTYSLISNKICNVPDNSGLWRLLSLKFDKSLSDENLCWHGTVGGFKDCNKYRKMNECGGKWWHFFPEQGFEEHLQKFHQLTNYSIAFQ